MDISVADVAASSTAGLILWAIKSLRDNRLRIEGTLQANREVAQQGLSEVNRNVTLIGVNVSTLKTWSEFHQKQDDERHEESKRERQQIWQTIERRKE